jgi:imidazolonepropionase-like amidohydrolase
MLIRLLQEASFDPETTRLLGLAYERASENVGPDGTIREEVARRIIEAAKRGERDLERLIQYGLGKKRSSGALRARGRVAMSRTTEAPLAPEVAAALAKAREYEALVAAAKDAKKRDYYARMSRKWFGIADGWRVITDVDKSH